MTFLEEELEAVTAHRHDQYRFTLPLAGSFLASDIVVVGAIAAWAGALFLWSVVASASSFFRSAFGNVHLDGTGKSLVAMELGELADLLRVERQRKLYRPLLWLSPALLFVQVCLNLRDHALWHKDAPEGWMSPASAMFGVLLIAANCLVLNAVRHLFAGLAQLATDQEALQALSPPASPEEE